MDLEDIKEMTDHAATHVFSREKCMITALVLFLCGLITLFCASLASHANSWAALSLIFLPLFITGALLIGLGVILIRVYHDEVKKRSFSYSALITKSWQTILLATYLFIPIIILYLLQWTIFGIFLLFKEVPFVGDLFNVILVFVPFLLNLGALLLCVISILVLFIVTPIIALRQIEQKKLLKYVLTQTTSSIFERSLLLAFALTPLIIVGFILWLAAHITFLPQIEVGTLYLLGQWLFIMIPFVIFLTPAWIFFFNIATEAHIYLQKKA